MSRVPASITFVSVEKETSARSRLVGSARAVHRRSRFGVFALLLWFISLLVVVLSCVGNPDLWGTYLYLACLSQLVPESQVISRFRPSTTSSMTPTIL